MPIVGTTHYCALTAVGLLALFTAEVEGPDDAQKSQAAPAQFAAPVRLMAGDAYLGEYRMYPSPAVYDWNGDGRVDVVIGDLKGHVAVAERGADGKLAAEVKAKTSDGKLLDFQNW